MMHFSIQDTEEIIDKGSQYTNYNLYINGSYHCSLRYSQFYHLNCKLKKIFPDEIFPIFPPKKLFNLSVQQIEDRRLELEKYIQALSQLPDITNSSYLNNFLLEVQKNQGDTSEEVMLEVFMPNKHKICVWVKTSDNTSTVLQVVAKKITLKENFLFYFGLFLQFYNEADKPYIVRQLQDYESPFFSLQIANKLSPHFISIRKIYWDSAFDEDLIEDRVAMNILYVQTATDIDSRMFHVSQSQQKDLCYLQNNGSKRDFLKLARTLKFYNCLLFENCFVDYPEPNMEVTLYIGIYELQFYPKNGVKILNFKVTRIRCWRLSTTENSYSNKYIELSFEYLISKENLKWISINSTQAILISSCIQSMVDELIMKRDNLTFEKNHQNKKNEAKSINGNPSTNQTISKSWNSNVTSFQSMTFTPLSDNEAFDGIKEDDL